MRRLPQRGFYSSRLFGMFLLSSLRVLDSGCTWCLGLCRMRLMHVDSQHTCRRLFTAGCAWLAEVSSISAHL
jgi:hypothetical protein